MFPDIGGMEYLVIAAVALIVFKPQDLPMIMKKVGQFMGNAKRMAADYRASFDDMARQSELDDLRREVEAMRSKAVQMTTDPVSGLADAMTNTADEIGESLGQAQTLADLPESAWMGQDVFPGVGMEPPVAEAIVSKAKPAAKKAAIKGARPKSASVKKGAAT